MLSLVYWATRLRVPWSCSGISTLIPSVAVIKPLWRTNNSKGKVRNKKFVLSSIPLLFSFIKRWSIAIELSLLNILEVYAVGECASIVKE